MEEEAPDPLDELQRHEDEGAREAAVDMLKQGRELLKRRREKREEEARESPSKVAAADSLAAQAANPLQLKAAAANRSAQQKWREQQRLNKERLAQLEAQVLLLQQENQYLRGIFNFQAAGPVPPVAGVPQHPAIMSGPANVGDIANAMGQARIQ